MLIFQLYSYYIYTCIQGFYAYVITIAIHSPMFFFEKDKWEKPHAVIIDLGVAEMFSVADPAGRFIGGTPTTMAPEAGGNPYRFSPT